jgi:hypothetical protein
MPQTRTGSIIEAVINVAVGYGVAVGAQVIVLPWILGVSIELEKNLLIGAIFTVISLARSYILRRVFTHYRLFRERS